MAFHKKELKIQMYRKIKLQYDEFSKTCSLPIGSSVHIYEIQKVIGRGAFASVFQCWDSQNQRKVALKVIDMKKHLSQLSSKGKQKLIQYSINEPYNLSHIQSPYIVKYYDNFENEDGSLKFLVMQLCSGPTLLKQVVAKWRLQNKHFSQQEALFLVRDVALGIKQLNSKKIMHRDLHPLNIMKNGSNYVILDLGLSKMVRFVQSREKATDVGNILTKAPQIIGNKKYGVKVDVWSLGVILYYILTREFLFKEQIKLQTDIISQIQQKLKVQLVQMQNQSSTLSQKKVSMEMRDLLRGMLQVNQDIRISIDDVLKHNVFNKYGIPVKIDQTKVNQQSQTLTFEEEISEILKRTN